MNQSEYVSDVLAALTDLAESKRKESAECNHPTKAKVLGVKVPDIRKVLKELEKQTKDFTGEEKLQLVKALMAADVFEAIQLAYLYLEKETKLLDSLSKEQIYDLQCRTDNWVLVDHFGALIVGYAWREGILSTEDVKAFYRSDNVWSRRIAITATISLNQKARGGEGDAVRTLEICEEAVDDHEDMVVKALSWALRVISQRDRDAVISFIETYKNRLHKRVLREVRNKLETGLKN